MANVGKGFDWQECLQAAASIESNVIELTSTLTESEFHAPTRIGGWSMSYCLEHLVLTGQAFLPRWDEALRCSPWLAPHETAGFRYAWWQQKLLRYVARPSAWKWKAPAPLVPLSRHTIAETVARFLYTHRELARRVAASSAVDARRARVTAPFIPWMQFALGYSFDLALAHERRHLSQAQSVRRQLLGDTVEIVRYDT